ncbi:MAG: elongation factor 1-alpha C-terminal domain-related protein [Brevinematia bacterium]
MIEYGKIKKGDKVIFYPSLKKSTIESIEVFPNSLDEAKAGECVGFTIKDKFFYISSGEIIAKENELQPFVSRRFIGNIFWMESAPLIVGKPYLAKIGTQKVNLKITEIVNVIDSADPENLTKKDRLERYDIGKCVFESLKPIASDTIQTLQKTSRFVVIDQYRISGCGIILEKLEDKILSLENEIIERERKWDKGYVSQTARELKHRHKGKFVLITGTNYEKIREIAKLLEKELFQLDKNTYFLSMTSVSIGLDKDLSFYENTDREEKIRRLGELSHILTDAGIIFVSYVADLKKYEYEVLKLLNSPYEIFIVKIGKEIETNFYDLIFNETENDDFIIKQIISALKENKIIEYFI